ITMVGKKCLIIPPIYFSGGAKQDYYLTVLLFIFQWLQKFLYPSPLNPYLSPFYKGELKFFPTLLYERRENEKHPLHIL
ncbi:MAG TPA: hypothetical protein PKK91_08115, partial [bacterium]|nr:hypothetical protein [bacterium]